ncbi:MAG: IS6 family transposase [Robiginitomaculum sp.]|nr:MAG: IS6 family transposase [Robiginitomaculum sp.]PHQ66848.1 MAG: IS6 family transposase [Robiginitomaculum sp.]
MKTSIYFRHRFHPDIIRKTIWLYFRFNLSFRDIEDMMAERGVDVSYETIRRWVNKFGLTYAKRIKRRSDKPSKVWHLDEVFVRIDGKLAYLWRAVDDEGTVLDVVVQTRRNRKAALRLIRKLLKNQGVKPERIVTDRLASYGAALRDIGLSGLQDVGGRKNNIAECSHVPIRRRERKAQRFRSIGSAQRLLSAYGQIYNLFNIRRHLISRNTMKIFRDLAMANWDIATSMGTK